MQSLYFQLHMLFGFGQNSTSVLAFSTTREPNKRVNILRYKISIGFLITTPCHVLNNRI
ncbi:hypothetical protein M5D96_002852 [Drosophila gunungcola]|uniref:Uncharacterized protein n=1 Tax=Drosophila gunungcola TaxID=103775 RepID=A0A9Q0BWV2_9MUSC|nr:hypothetical protein M5D96_002852 [Drosophila gunungcola]